METRQLSRAPIESEDDSTCLCPDIFEINTGKSQGSESVLGTNSKKHIFRV